MLYRRRMVSSVLGSLLLLATVAAPAIGQSTSPGRIPDKLVLGLVPSSEADTLITNAKPLADYLTTALGIPVESFVPTDYTGLVVAMGTGQADIGALAPFTLVQAADEEGAVIILQSVRNGSLTYHAQWFTNTPETYCTDAVVTRTAQSTTDPPVELTLGFCNGTLDAIVGPLAEDSLASIAAGTTVAFVEQASASGYIFPAVQLINAGIDPTVDVTPLFAGGHDKTVISACKGDAQIGVSFNDARTLAAAVEACGDDLAKVVVFALSPEIPNDGVAVAGDLDSGLRQRIADALLAYGNSPEGSAVLQSIYRITSFAPANLASFDIVREAAQKVGAPE